MSVLSDIVRSRVGVGKPLFSALGSSTPMTAGAGVGAATNQVYRKGIDSNAVSNLPYNPSAKGSPNITNYGLSNGYPATIGAGVGAVLGGLYGTANTTPAHTTPIKDQLNTTQNNLYNSVNAQPTQFTAYQPFQFTQANIEADPTYQAALAAARQNIQTSQNNTLANLTANGQGHSSYADTVAQQIANKGMADISNNLLPQLIQQAYQRHVSDFNLNNQIENQNYGAAQDQLHNQSALTSFLNGQQQQDYLNRQNEKKSNLDAAAKISDMFGKVITPQTDWSGLLRQAANPNTPYTPSGQINQQNIAMNDQTMHSKQLNDAWQTANNLGYVTPELSKLTGIPEGTQTQDAINAADNSAYQWAALDNRQQNQSNGSQGGLTANQVLDSIRSLYTDPVYQTDSYGQQKKVGTQITTDPAKREQMFLNVVDAGLSDAETNQILSSLGMTKKEISQYMQKYGGK